MFRAVKDPKTGIYQCRGTYLGVAPRISLKTRDRRIADAAIDRIKTDIEWRVIHGRKPPVTFAEAAILYIRAGGERRFLPPILRHFGEATLCQDIDAERVDQAERALYPLAAPATVRRQLHTPIRAVLNTARAERRGDAPFLNHRRRRQRGRDSIDTARTRWLEVTEFLALETAAQARIADADAAAAQARAAIDASAAAIEKRQAKARYGRAVQAANGARQIAAIIGILIGTGMRTSEALTLDVTLYYPATAQAYIDRTKSAVPRMVRYPARIAPLLSLIPVPDDGALFRTPRGAPYSVAKNTGGNIADAFGQIRAAAGLGDDVTPHVLRHTWATWYYAETQNLRGLMDLGGWAKPDMAMRYTKLAPADLASRLRKIGWTFADPARPPARTKRAI